MNRLPAWIPNLNAWMSAILLILLTRGLAVVIRIIIGMSSYTLTISPKMKFLLYVAALLSPILVIAVAHHLLHLILDRYFPESRSQEMRGVQGIFPTLLSWWEGFYGWMAIELAFLLSIFIEVIFSSAIDSQYNMLQWWDELKDLFTISTLIRTIIAAYLYQLESVVRQHLISIGSSNNSN